jgi:preprotein translocase subunit YajC
METATTSGADIFAQFLPLIGLFAIFYFLVIRPQQTQAKNHTKMVDELKKDDKIVTTGGLIVKILKVEEDFFKVDLGDVSNVKLEKTFVSRKIEIKDK